MALEGVGGEVGEEEKVTFTPLIKRAIIITPPGIMINGKMLTIGEGTLLEVALVMNIEE